MLIPVTVHRPSDPSALPPSSHYVRSCYMITMEIDLEERIHIPIAWFETWEKQGWCDKRTEQRRSHGLQVHHGRVTTIVLP